MTETLAKTLQVVTASQAWPCCRCPDEIDERTSMFWRVTAEGVVERWHIECDPEYQRRRALEMRAEEDAEINAIEAGDVAEDRHLRSLDDD